MILQAINLKQKDPEDVVRLLTADEYRRKATICTYAGIAWIISFIIAMFLFVLPFFQFINLIVQNYVTLQNNMVLRKLIPSVLFLGGLFLIFKCSLMLVMKYLGKRKTHCPYCGALPSGKERIEAVIKSGTCWNCKQAIVNMAEE